MPVKLEEAAEYVKSIDLSGTPRNLVGQDAATEAGEVFATAKAQAQVVGSGLYSFAKGVTPVMREAISNSALLAQLVANKRASADAAPVEWYGAYLDVLENVGWTIQDHGWKDYTAEGTDVEVHEKIIEVLQEALGPAPAALAIIKSAVDMMKTMRPDTSWLTIFSREAQHARMARFQVGLVESGEDTGLVVSLLACIVEADVTLTQVLAFKLRNERATFRGNSASVSLLRENVERLLPAIRTKVRAYQADYVSSIQDI